MTVSELSRRLGWEVLVEGEASSREITKIYCCDLLSFVMGRAPADSAWITVMGNVNAMAVALLADVACVVLAEGASLDGEAAEKASQHGIAVLSSGGLPVYESAKAVCEATGL